jgi:hypothetical protein
MYGGGWVNAVYQMDKIGNSKVLGQMGYVDENKQLSTYPSSMFAYNNTNTYNKIAGYDSAGNDLGSIGNSSVSGCETACNGNEACAGFVFSTDTNTCYPKNSSMYPKGVRTPNSKTDLYVRKPSVNNSSSCSKDIVNIDSVQWTDFTNTNTEMTPSTLCGLSKEVNSEQTDLDAMKAKMALLATKIVNKINGLEAMNLNLNDQMGIDKKVLDENLIKYKEVAAKYAYYTKHEASNIHGIVSDSNVVVLYENYNYILWSVLAVGIVIITINMMRKKSV